MKICFKNIKNKTKNIPENNEQQNQITTEQLERCIAEMATAAYRFCPVIEKAINQFEISDRNRYYSQLQWFSKSIEKSLDRAGVKIAEYSVGEMYDPGMPVNPMNISEFEENDTLYIEQIIEPVIMSGGRVIKEGVVALGRVTE